MFHHKVKSEKIERKSIVLYQDQIMAFEGWIDHIGMSNLMMISPKIEPKCDEAPKM